MVASVRVNYRPKPPLTNRAYSCTVSNSAHFATTHKMRPTSNTGHIQKYCNRRIWYDLVLDQTTEINNEIRLVELRRAGFWTCQSRKKKRNK